MATTATNINPLQLKRGSIESVSAYVAAEGEPLWAIDEHRLFVGDGTTAGGWEVTGATGTTGAIGYTGSKGATGLGFTIAKTYISVAALEADTSPTGIVAGQFAIIENGNPEDPENSRLYLWNAGVYTYTSDLSGAQGITGATGYTGSQGAGGTIGSTGYTGSQGAIGYRGSAGEAGVSGYTGSQGIQGDTGYTGSAGTNGNDGSIGYTGSQGIQGPGFSSTGTSVVSALTVTNTLVANTGVFENITVNHTATVESILFSGSKIRLINDTGIDAIEIGFGATASSNYPDLGGIAIGDADATGAGSIAIGSNSSAAGVGSLAMAGGNASGGAGVAIGAGASAGDFAIGLGYTGNASGSLATALNGNATAERSIAIGVGANADHFGSIVIASSSTVNSTGSGLYIDPIRNTTSTQVLYYDETTKEITYGIAPSSNQGLNTTDNAIFKSVQATQVLSSGGFPLDSNGKAMTIDATNPVFGGPFTPAMMVTNQTAGLLPTILFRGYGQNQPGGGVNSVGSPSLWFEPSRGSNTAPTGVKTSDVLMNIIAGGHDGTKFSSDRYWANFQIQARAAENWAGSASTATNAGVELVMRLQPPNVILNGSSRQRFFAMQWQNTGTTTAPPEPLLSFGTAANDNPTLTHSNGINTVTGFGATRVQWLNADHRIFGVPFEDTTADNTTLPGKNKITFATSRRNGVYGRRNIVQAGDTLGTIDWRGQSANNAVDAGYTGASLYVKAVDTFSGTARGSSVSINTAEIGTTNYSDRLVLASDENGYTSEKHRFADSESWTRAEIRKDYTHFDTDLFEVRDPTNIVLLKIDSGGVRLHDAYTFPTTDGAINQVLSTDGIGNTTWVDQSQGPIGYTGSQGTTGETGSTGAQGNIGYTGSQGEQGIQGDIGYTGSQGIGYTPMSAGTGIATDGSLVGSNTTYVYVADAGAYAVGDFVIIKDTESGSTFYYYARINLIQYAGGFGWAITFDILGYGGTAISNPSYTWSVRLSGIKGAIGYTGSQGIQGNTGTQGIIGYTGSKGDVGPAGTPGNTGTSGSFTGTTIYPIVTSDVTQSTSVATGSIIGAGGLGITKNAYVGGLISVAGVLYAGDGTNATLANNGAARITGGLGVSRDIVAGGLITAGREQANAGTGEGITYAIYSNIFLTGSKKTTTNSTGGYECYYHSDTNSRTAKYLYQVMQGTGTNVHCGEILTTSLNGNTYMVESNVITSGGELGVWSTTHSGNNFSLFFTPNSSAAMTVKVSAMTITS